MLEEYRICIKPGAVPFSITVAKWIPTPLREVVKDELDTLEMEGVIRRVYKPTPWCAGLMVGPKDSWRTPLMCWPDQAQPGNLAREASHAYPWPVAQTAGLCYSIVQVRCQGTVSSGKPPWELTGMHHIHYTLWSLMILPFALWNHISTRGIVIVPNVKDSGKSQRLCEHDGWHSHVQQRSLQAWQQSSSSLHTH